MNRIIIIGNGSKALTNENGKFIDESDIVIRLNNFKIDGFEKYVGTKIDIYSCWSKILECCKLSKEQRYSLWKQTIAEPITENFEKVFAPNDVDFDRLKSVLFLWTKNKDDKILKECSFYDKIKVLDFDVDMDYSTGFRTILYCLHHFKNEKIYITGFDSFMKSGWYWDVYGLTNNIQRTENFTDGHPWLIECKKLNEMIKSKTLILI
jgi:hypothetical protein